MTAILLALLAATSCPAEAVPCQVIGARCRAEVARLGVGAGHRSAACQASIACWEAYGARCLTWAKERP